MEPVTPKRIQSERNSEYRRVLMQRYGMAEYICDVGATEVSRDEWGILYDIQQPDEQNIRVMLVDNVTPESDGSFRPYAICVPPDVETPEQGQLAIMGVRDYRNAEYQPLMES
jgi:hypothetical protein